MVGFGKKLREVQNPEWKQYYIDYKMMKKKLKEYVERCAEGATEAEKEEMRRQFTRLLDWQVEKIVLFLLEQQGYLAARLSSLGSDRESVRASADRSLIAHHIDSYRRIGSHLLDLLHYVEVNATGIRKILKKFDKRAAHRLTDYYVASRSNNPYSQLQQVFRHVGIGAMVGALTRSIAELKNHTTSIYDEPKSFLNVEEPIIQSIKVAQERLTDSTNFLKYVAKQMLGEVKEEEERPCGEDEYISQQYHVMSLLLNLGNTFLYMVNTYIIVPTADKYADRLGAAPTLCGVVIGAMAVAQLLSSVYFSAWSNTSYNQPLLFSSAVLIIGNLLYALAYDVRSLPLLILGRVFCGLGSARAVNRRYVSDWVPLKTRLKASAGFVSASALGMAVGPALAGVFEVRKEFAGLTFDSNTLPGWVMAGAWVIYMVWLLLGFKEPARRPLAPAAINGGQQYKSANKSVVKPIECSGRRAINGYTKEDAGSMITQPLLISDMDHSVVMVRPPPSSEANHTSTTTNDDRDYDCDDEEEEEDDREIGGGACCDSNDEQDDESKEPVTSMAQAYRLLTTPVKVQLLIYFMLKYAMEIVLSESSVVTAFYFDWTTRAVAAFLAILGLTVLPVNYLVGSFVSNIFEDRQILFASELITCLGLAICFAGPVRYTVAQYVTGSLITFVAAEVLEGVNLSLLSKVMSARLSRGTYNNGLLSTEAGTLARVFADGTITLAGYLGTRFLLNLTLAPALLIGLVSLTFTSYSYHSLF